jgi:hypothetical protein
MKEQTELSLPDRRKMYQIYLEAELSIGLTQTDG